MDRVERLRWKCTHAYEKAPAMTKRFDDVEFHSSQIKSLEDMEKIFISTRDDYVRIQPDNPPFGDFMTVPLETLKRIYIHPGP